MTDTMRSISDALPSTIPAIADPWLGVSDLGTQLPALVGWAAIALIATAWLTRRTSN